MSARAISTTPHARARRRHRRIDRTADRALRGLCIVASALVAVLIADIGYQLVHGGSLAMSRFGLSFLREGAWKPNFDSFGAGPLLYGTAVTQVIGAGTGVHASLFETGDTLASRIASQFQGSVSDLHTSALFYLAVVLLAIGLVTNLLAQWIGHRFAT